MYLLGSCGSAPWSRNASPAFHLSRSKQQWGGADLSLQNVCSHQGAELTCPCTAQSRGRPALLQLPGMSGRRPEKSWSCARRWCAPIILVCLETECVCRGWGTGCAFNPPWGGSKEGLQIHHKCIPKSAVGGDRRLGTHPRCCGQIRRVIV